MIIAVHDLNLAYRYADAVLVPGHGRMTGYGGPHAMVIPDCIRTVYGIDSFLVGNEFGKFILPFRGHRAAGE
jgi:iron complex transport system ATP-binding protein